MNLWIEAAMLPFLLVLVVALATRFRTTAELNRRYLSLALSTLAALALDVLSALLLHRSHLVETAFHAAATLNAYCLMRYVAAYVKQEDSKFAVLLNRGLAALCFGLLLLNLLAGAPLNPRVFGAFAPLFTFEAFCLQLVHQRYYDNSEFVVLNLLFLLLIDAFVVQYIFAVDLRIIYVVVSILLIVTFFYLEAPTYRQLVTAKGDMEAARLAAERSIAQANRAQKAKADFLANTSHEIRTPMNAILGMNEMILNTLRKGRGPQESLEAAMAVRKAGNHLLNIINNILDLAKIESGKMELFESEYHLCRLLRDWEAGAREALQDKPAVSFSLNAEKSLPEHLFGDEGHLNQIIRNLLDNAIKYTRAGSVTLTVSGGMGKDGRLRLVLTVQDTGLGIREEEQERIYEPFERANVLEIQNILGAGLGLPLARELVRLMGGSLRSQSEYGKGSTFTVEVTQALSIKDPLTIQEYEEKVRRGEIQEPREEPEDEPFTCPNMKVLVVDDTPVNLVVAKGMMSPTQARVDTAESGEEALRMMRKTHYDLVFLDHRMPGMDGVETLHRAKPLSGGTAFIALTANAGSGAEADYVKLGFDGYLPKPFKSEAMIATLRKFWRRGAAPAPSA